MKTPSPVTDNMKVMSNTVTVSTALPVEEQKKPQPNEDGPGEPEL
ncbi:hypothetical protein [Castellaniella caeni]|nr:hypothetical protein [Castellaniella caeni]